MRQGWTAPALQLESSATEVVCLRKTAGRYTLRGCDFPPQSGQNDFEHRKTRHPSYFMLVTVECETSSWVCPGSHVYVHFRASDKLTLAKTVEVGEVVIDMGLVSVGHGYL